MRITLMFGWKLEKKKCKKYAKFADIAENVGNCGYQFLPPEKSSQKWPLTIGRIDRGKMCEQMFSKKAEVCTIHNSPLREPKRGTEAQVAFQVNCLLCQLLFRAPLHQT